MTPATLAHETTHGMSFGTADDLTAISLALMEAANNASEAARRADRLLRSRDLAEGELMDIRAARQALDALPAILAVVARPLAHLFAQAEAVGDLAGQRLEPADDSDIPF